MEGDDPVRARGRPPEDLRGAPHLLVAHAARLVPPGPHRVEPGDDERLGAVHRLGRLPSRSNSAPGPGEPPGNEYGMSWLPGIASSGSSRPRRNDDARSCWLRRPRWVKSPLAITSSGRASSTSLPSASIDSGLSFAAEMQVGEVENTCRHGRLRLYSPADGGRTESPEIFDDLYLGLRAGGALRKQRRGEPLTTEEQEALGRWQRLSIGARHSRSARSRSAPSALASPSAA